MQDIQGKLRRSFTDILKRSRRDLKHVAVQRNASKQFTLFTKVLKKVLKGSQKSENSWERPKPHSKRLLIFHDTIASSLQTNAVKRSLWRVTRGLQTSGTVFAPSVPLKQRPANAETEAEATAQHSVALHRSTRSLPLAISPANKGSAF